jgi:hypothetical protein
MGLFPLFGVFPAIIFLKQNRLLSGKGAIGFDASQPLRLDFTGITRSDPPATRHQSPPGIGAPALCLQIKNSKDLLEKVKRLEQIRGMGKITINTLPASMSGLGALSDTQEASLARDASFIFRH